MRIVRNMAAAFAMVVVCASGAAAQDRSTVGITMGYPASVGIIWHLGDKIAIRPELTFSGSSSESTTPSGSTVETESEGWTLGTGISALFYLHDYDRLRTYFSPRFTYNKVTSTISSTNGVFNSSSTGRASTYGIAGNFGAEGRIADKFSAFGEVGFGYNHTTTSSSSSSTRVEGDSWGTRAGVGVIFYF
jgi:hypothetical protein